MKSKKELNIALDTMPSFPKSGTFFVRLEARAAFRIRRERPILLHLSMGDGRRIDMKLETEYDLASDLPRPIIIVSVQVAGTNLDEATNWTAQFIRSYLLCLAVAMNAAVEDAAVLYAVDISSKSSHRAFFQSQSKVLRQAIPSETRLVQYEAAVEFVQRIIDADKVDNGRLNRAVQQYVLALRQWSPETKVLAVAHAFMAAEALTPVAKRSLNMTDDQLFEMEKNEKRAKYDRRARDKQHVADVRARRLVTFDGDSKTLAGAKELSDGFEHGYGDYLKLIELAEKHGDNTLKLMRRAIIRLAKLNEPSKIELLDQRFDLPVPLFTAFSMFGTLPEATPLDELYDTPLEMSSITMKNAGYNQDTGTYAGKLQVSPTAKRSVTVEGYRFRA